MKKIIILIAFLLNTAAQATEAEQPAPSSPNFVDLKKFKKYLLEVSAAAVQSYINLFPEDHFCVPLNRFRGINANGISFTNDRIENTCPAEWIEINPKPKAQGFMNILKSWFYTTKELQQFNPVAFCDELNKPNNTILYNLFTAGVISSDFSTNLIAKHTEINKLVSETNSKKTETHLTATAKILLASLGVAGLYHYFKIQ